MTGKAAEEMKVLIVEDNAAVRRTLRAIISDIADEICECDDGDRAVQTYRDEKPDCVLMDIDLNGSNGITATGVIRGHDPTARVIIVTSYDEADLREEARRAGASAYVLKENLLEVRRELLRR